MNDYKKHVQKQLAWVKKHRLKIENTLNFDSKDPYSPPEFPANHKPAFDLPHNLRPINPYERTGLQGRGELWRFGPNMAVDSIVLSKNGKALLIKRTDNGLWSTPGGFIEAGDTPLETSIKECSEETGIVLTEHDRSDLYQKVTPRPEYVFGDWRNTDNAWIMTYVYLYEVDHEDTNFDPDHEIEDVGWFSFEEILNLDRSVYQTDKVLNFMSFVGKVT